MKKVFTFFALLALGSHLMAATPNFDQMGFSTIDHLTTGGAGGKVVTPANLAEFKQYAEADTTPYIILINKEINTGIDCYIDDSGHIASSGTATTYGDIVHLGSNKTIIGTNCDALFNRIGLNVQCHSNIIVRNVKFTMTNVPIDNNGENKVVGFYDGAEKVLNDPDCFSVQADDESIAEADRLSDHIWVDHCEFYNEDPDVMTDYDRYDGLLDTKNNSIYITISWCYFHDHHKSCLIGKGNSDAYNHKTTFSHNKFEKIASRLPLFRYGNGHMLNNYFYNCENGSNCRINSDLYIEGNFYQDVKKPVFGKTSENGAATFAGNIFNSCSKLPAIIGANNDGAKSSALSSSEEVLAGSWNPSTEYSYTADSVAEVPDLINANAGVCVLTEAQINSFIDESNPSTIAQVSANSAQVYTTYGTLVVKDAAGKNALLFDANGNLLTGKTIVSDEEPIESGLSKGIYLLLLNGKGQKVVIE